MDLFLIVIFMSIFSPCACPVNPLYYMPPLGRSAFVICPYTSVFIPIIVSYLLGCLPSDFTFCLPHVHLARLLFLNLLVIILVKIMYRFPTVYLIKPRFHTLTSLQYCSSFFLIIFINSVSIFITSFLNSESGRLVSSISFFFLRGFLLIF